MRLRKKIKTEMNTSIYPYTISQASRQVFNRACEKNVEILLVCPSLTGLDLKLSEFMIRSKHEEISSQPV